jgi:hypothetical protein
MEFIQMCLFVLFVCVCLIVVSAVSHRLSPSVSVSVNRDIYYCLCLSPLVNIDIYYVSNTYQQQPEECIGIANSREGCTQVSVRAFWILPRAEIRMLREPTRTEDLLMT